MGVPTGTAIIGHHFDDFSWKCHGPSRGVCRIEFVCPRMQGGRRHSTVCSGMEFGTNSVQLRERKNGFLAPKRHKMKHLDFLILLLESKRSREATSQSAHALRRGCAGSLVCAFLQTEGPERRQSVCNTSARKLCIIS